MWTAEDGLSSQVASVEAGYVNEMIFGRRYRATEKIGSGGMAEVYKAVDETLGRTVAVKVLHPRYASDPNFATRFRREAQAAAQLQSPNIVNMYDWGQDGDTYYIVMELVRGTDLKNIITENGPLESKRVAEIGAQVCSALSVAHGYDVIHRDIKPHNIMVAPDGSVKVMDFGIARAGNTTMTQTGSVLGTAHYVSPEQAQGRELKAQSDLYSLGVVLYEAATGRVPFDAETPVAVALKQVNEQPVRPTRVNPRVDLGLERVIGRALSKDPSKRYDTAEEMRRDLLRVVSGEQTSAQATSVIPTTPSSDHTSVLPQITETDPYAGGGAPTIRPVPQKRPVWPWIAVAVVLLIGGFIVANALGLLGPQGVPVPSLIGKTQVEAEAMIVEAGFTVGEVTERNDDSAAGTVLDQSPVANASADKGSAVNLVISIGPELAEVPTLIGLPEEEALALLEETGFVAQPLPDEFNEKVKAGEVFKQAPAPGEMVQKGSSVQYVASRGVESVKVPNVVGMTRANAESALREAGFKVSPSEQFDSKVAAGKVISQNPKADLQVARGSSVAIVVSKGQERVSVPDVIGRSQIDATNALEEAGFKVNISYEPHANNNMVLEQDPSPGSSALKGTTVELLIDGVAP